VDARGNGEHHWLLFICGHPKGEIMAENKEGALEFEQKVREHLRNKQLFEAIELLIKGLNSYNNEVVIAALDILREKITQKRFQKVYEKLIPAVSAKLPQDEHPSWSDYSMYRCLEYFVYSKAIDVVLKIAKVNPEAVSNEISIICKSLHKSKDYDYSEMFLIAHLARIDVNLVKEFLPAVKRVFLNSPIWNDRRGAALVVGAVGKQDFDLIQDVYPNILHYIANPELTKKEHMMMAEINEKTHNELMACAMVGADLDAMLIHACVDYALLQIAETNPIKIKDSKPVLKKLIAKDLSECTAPERWTLEYAQKKAKKVLELIEKDTNDKNG